MALEYHGKATAVGHWRKNQELVDALAYIDPLTPDVKQQVDKMIEEEMRRSTLRPQDYLNKLPPMPPAKFEGHPLLQKEYERCGTPCGTSGHDLCSFLWACLQHLQQGSCTSCKAWKRCRCCPTCSRLNCSATTTGYTVSSPCQHWMYPGTGWRHHHR